MADRLAAMETTTNENHLRKASAALSPPLPELLGTRKIKDE
jgi:hypothetical protein